MYNPDLKERFIQSVTDSEYTEKIYRQIFRVSEPYETNAALDLCQMDAEAGKPLANALVGVSGASVSKRLSLAKMYVKWCVKNGVPGAIEDFLTVSPNLYRNITHRMVSGPIMLENYLDQVFDRPEEKTVHNIYRLYLWLGFLGIPRSRVSELRSSAVDLARRTVTVDGVDYAIVDEALPVFRNCVGLGSFQVRYRYTMLPKPRTAGSLILRGFSDDFSVSRLSIKVTTLEANAEREGKTARRITYEHARLSGVFFRMLNAEMAGVEVDFREEAQRLTREETETHGNATEGREQQRSAARESNLKKDYERWKLAFFV